VFNQCLTSLSVFQHLKHLNINTLSSTYHSPSAISKTFVKHLTLFVADTQSLTTSVRHLYSDRQIC